MQFWLLLPVAYLLIRASRGNMLVAIACAAVPEIAFTLIAQHINKEVADAAWRVLPVRYAFLAYVAYIYIEGERLRTLIAPFAVLSAAFIAVGRYKLVDLSPFFYVSSAFAWNGVAWPMFFFTALLFHVLYRLAPRTSPLVSPAVVWLGKNSWLTFCGQMLFFAVCRKDCVVNNQVPFGPIVYAMMAIASSVAAAHLYILATRSVNHRRTRATVSSPSK